MSENAKQIRSIAIRIPNWVGDAVMATPLLRSLRGGYPEARICLVGKSGVLDLLKGLPYFDETLVLKAKGFRRTLAMAAELRKNSYDLGVILPNSFSSALAFFLGGVKKRTGYALNQRTFLLNRSIRPAMEGRRRRPSAMTRYYLDLARFCGGAETSEDMELSTGSAEDEEAERFLRSRGLDGAPLLVGLNPGASFGPSKLWTPEGFARVSDRVHEEMNGRTLLLCGPNEEEIADGILQKARHAPVDTSRNVLPLGFLKSVIRRLDALVTTDTGPRHFAAALKVPAVVVMGPTDPRYTDTNMDRTRVIRIDLDCSPCHKKECDSDHRCMRKINGDLVFEAMADLLNRKAAKSQGGKSNGKTDL